MNIKTDESMAIISMQEYDYLIKLKKELLTINTERDVYVVSFNCYNDIYGIVKNTDEIIKNMNDTNDKLKKSLNILYELLEDLEDSFWVGKRIRAIKEQCFGIDKIL